MGRKRLFCQQQILQKILCLFWEKGFEATSIRDIAEAIDVPIASLYHCFGDKNGILRRAIAEYDQNITTPALTSLSEHPDAQAALKDFFVKISTPCLDAPPGCFAILMSDQTRSHDPALAAEAQAVLDRIRAGLGDCVHRINPSLDVNCHADVLLGHLIAIKAMQRNPANDQIIRHYVELAVLPGIAALRNTAPGIA